MAERRSSLAGTIKSLFRRGSLSSNGSTDRRDIELDKAITRFHNNEETLLNMITTAKLFVKSVKSDIENRSAIAKKLTDIYSVDDQSQSPTEIAGISEYLATCLNFESSLCSSIDSMMDKELTQVICPLIARYHPVKSAVQQREEAYSNLIEQLNKLSKVTTTSDTAKKEKYEEKITEAEKVLHDLETALREETATLEASTTAVLRESLSVICSIQLYVSKSLMGATSSIIYKFNLGAEVSTRAKALGHEFQASISKCATPNEGEEVISPTRKRSSVTAILKPPSEAPPAPPTQPSNTHHERASVETNSSNSDGVHGTSSKQLILTQQMLEEAASTRRRSIVKGVSRSIGSGANEGNFNSEAYSGDAAALESKDEIPTQNKTLKFLPSRTSSDPPPPLPSKHTRGAGSFEGEKKNYIGFYLETEENLETLAKDVPILYKAAYQSGYGPGGLPVESDLHDSSASDVAGSSEPTHWTQTPYSSTQSNGNQGNGFQSLLSRFQKQK